MLELGHRFSAHVALQEQHTLQTTGWYARVRHPSYLGLILLWLGFALTFRSLVGVLLLAPIVLLLLRRMNSEERFLAEQFGDAYRDYMQRTSRLLPGVY
jgi:protein-S-isoprenylcysteine O-methyltransferase Ste14